jgi:hypothetical protein
MSLRSLGLITDETMREHRARWLVWAGPAGGPREKIPHTANMRGHWPGWDVACSCGWESCTGGATRSYVASKLDDHRFDAQGVAERLAGGRPVTAIRGLRDGQRGIETMPPSEDGGRAGGDAEPAAGLGPAAAVVPGHQGDSEGGRGDEGPGAGAGFHPGV